MVEKRPLEGANTSADAATTGSAGDAAAKKPKLSLEALEKAKRALQLQKELKEKMKKLPQLQQAPPAAAPAPSETVQPVAPPPQLPVVPAPGTASVALPPPPPLPAPNELPSQAPAPGAFFDPRMTDNSFRKLSRRPKATFEFVEQGEFQRQADAFRLRARYGRDAVPSAFPFAKQEPLGPSRATPEPGPIQAALPGSRETTPAPQQEEVEVLEPIPDVEWWDKGLLAHGSYEQDVPEDTNQPVAIKDNKITHYVEHPVPIQPPAEPPPPAPAPMKLTAKEIKKLRTQRRQAREREKQDLIRQGLLEPPKPKVKLSNMYRVLGDQAVLDPTAIEAETRREAAERRQRHEDRNLARALTPAEKREKKLRRMFDDNGLDLITSVFKVSRMDHPQNKYKVDINAKENHMTGILLISPKFTLVVVEGCKKATKRYTKLMLRRIDWTAPPPAGRDANGVGGLPADMLVDGGAGMQEDGLDELDAIDNRCDLVWQGIVKDAAFEGFKVETCRTVEHAQQILSQHNVRHYWDAAHNFTPGDAIGLELQD